MAGKRSGKTMCALRIATVGDGDMDVYNNIGTFYPGGNAVNVGVHLYRLGVDTAFVGAVGTDDYGSRVIEALKQEGLDTSHIQILPGETAVSNVEFIDNERVFGEYTDGVMLDFKLREEDIDFLCGYTLVHSAMWGMVHNDLHKLRSRGVLVSFDFADKLENNPVTEIAIENCDYAIFSYTEDDSYIRGFLKRMQARGPKVVVATLGANGSLAYDGQEYTTCGIVPVKVLDTMGAGDSWIAGFITGIVKGLPLKNAMQLGAQTASETIQYMGAW